MVLSPQSSFRLLLLRHAKAVRARAGEQDFDRGLEPSGSADASKIGAFLTRRDLTPERALVSSARRARDTFAQAARGWPAPPAAIFEPRLYEAKAETILELVRKTSHRGDLLVVGHNPGLHELANLLIASGDVEARERLRENLPTAGLVVLEFAVGSWNKVHPRSARLDLFIAPGMLDAAVD